MKVNTYMHACTHAEVNNNLKVSGLIFPRRELSIRVRLWDCLSSIYCCSRVRLISTCMFHRRSSPTRLPRSARTPPWEQKIRKRSTLLKLKLLPFYFAFTVKFDIEVAAWTDCLNMNDRNGQQLEIASAFFFFFFPDFWYEIFSPCCFPFLVQNRL